MIPFTSRRSPVYTGTGTTASFDFAFKVFDRADVSVKVTDTNFVESTLGLDTDYTVSLNADQDNYPGGSVNLTAGDLATGKTLVIVGDQDYSQTTQLPSGGAYNAAVMEKALDRQTIMSQQLLEIVGRTLQYPYADTAIGSLPPAGDRASKFLAFDATGKPIVASGTGADTALRTDLAAPTGGSLSGFLADVVEAVARTMLAKVREGWLTPEDCGAKGNGVDDDDAALRKWAAAVGHPLKRIPGGKTYKCNPATPYDFVPGDWVTGDGNSSVIDASGGTLPAGGVVFRMAGAFTSLGKIMTSGAAAGVVSFPVSSVAGLAKGDVICIHNNTSSSWSAWRAEYHAGEFVEIGNIVGTTIYPTLRLWDAYPSTVDVYKLDNRGGYFGNFRIKTQAAQIVGWQFDALVGPKVDSVRVEGTTYAGGEFKRCYNIEGRGNAFQSSPSTDDEYGITVSNSQRGNLYMSATGGRHPISFGGGLYAGCVPVRSMRVYGGYFGNLGPTGSGDAHGNTQDIQWNGTLFANGLDIGGADHMWNQCVIAGNTNSGIGLYLGEPVKGSFTFNACIIDTVVNPNAGGFGLVHLANLANAKAAIDVVLNACEYRAPAAMQIPIWVNLSSGTYAPNVIVNGGLNKCAGVTQFVRLERSGGASTIGLVKVRELSGLPAGAYWAINVSTASLTVSKYDLPPQAGTVNVGIGTAASVYSAAVNLPRPYPTEITPILVPGLTASTIGGKRAKPAAVGASNTSFSAEIATCDGANFASADTGVFRWHAAIAD